MFWIKQTGGQASYVLRMETATAMAKELGKSPGAALGAGMVMIPPILGPPAPTTPPPTTSTVPATPPPPPPSTQSVIKCPKCGRNVSADFEYCPYCGTKLPKASYCPHCGALLPPGAKFCPKCGKPIQ